MWVSAWRDFGGAGALSVLDVGGGSTEFTWGDGPEPLGRVSLQVGAVRLTERVVETDPVGEARANIAVTDRLRALARDLAGNADLVEAQVNQDAAAATRIVLAALYGG